ncbi:MAG: radical SAM protein [Lachnospiraceae bacterium]|jgi:MoaA/NifB/PqqE/SkfB family radical SAM enzyme|nr:radical SAM protein [Lachnospiraceae bacterium]
MANLAHAAERQTISVMLDGLLKHLNNTDDKAKTYLKMVDMAQKFIGNDENKDRFDSARNAIEKGDNRWLNMITGILESTDPHVAKMILLDLGFEAFLNGTKTIRTNREKYNCNIPWLILFDPTQACNMHCVGCWSGTYGHKSNLSFEDMDKIVTEGKALGSYLYMLTGGEPMVRKADILKLMEKHQDCYFAAYSNSTLIDQALCDEIKRLGNLTFMLSIEGTPDTNDSRRGDGHYDAVMKAMDLLHENGIPFGTSICYTRQNIDAVTDEKFLRMLADKGAHFGFYFHYMPVGKNAVMDLMPTVEQRKAMIDKIRYIRSDKCDIPFFPMDFQNDGEFVGGCIAGGRNYFHINANGDAEPCVFIHYSNTNIHDNSILEMLQSPLFMAYHEGQPFNRNHLKPCPMLENPELLKEMVAKTKAHQTNIESPEEASELCDKNIDYAKEWAPVADEVWANETHNRPSYENYTTEKIQNPELAAFEHAAE